MGQEIFFAKAWSLLKIFIILELGFTSNYGTAQNWNDKPWPGSWITHPTAPATEFAVVNFRRNFDLEVFPDSLRVMVSVDNRYQLFVNGQRVGESPSRGDLAHCRYETYDLRPYIRTGKNVIVAVVRNYGINRPYSEENYRLGFLRQLKSSVLKEVKKTKSGKLTVIRLILRLLVRADDWERITLLGPNGGLMGIKYPSIISYSPSIIHPLYRVSTMKSISTTSRNFSGVYLTSFLSSSS